VPITSTIRGTPSEVQVGVREGLKRESAIDLDHVQTVEQNRLTGSSVPSARRRCARSAGPWLSRPVATG